MAGAESSAFEADRAGGRLGKGAMALLIIGVVLFFDLLTKAWVVRTFTLYESVPVLGDFFRFTYTHNRGAAFGIHVGEHSRVFFLSLSLVALAVLALIYRATPTEDRVRLAALALVAGGAIGNIIDRLRYERGVVDFLDVGIGAYRWPVFNVADMAVSSGAILLLISFYMEGKHEEAVRSGGADGAEEGAVDGPGGPTAAAGEDPGDPPGAEERAAGASR